MLNHEYVVMLSKRETDIKDHLLTLYHLVQKVGGGVVVELGAGQSTYALTAAVNDFGGRFFSIDKLPEAHLRGFAEGRGVLEKEPSYHHKTKPPLERY